MTDEWITLRCSSIVSLGGQAERQEAGRKDDGGEARAGSVRWARGWRDEGPHRASRNGLQCVLSPGYEIAILQTWPHPCGHTGAPESRLFDGALQPAPGVGRVPPSGKGIVIRPGPHWHPLVLTYLPGGGSCHYREAA